MTLKTELKPEELNFSGQDMIDGRSVSLSTTQNRCNYNQDRGYIDSLKGVKSSEIPEFLDHLVTIAMNNAAHQQEMGVKPEAKEDNGTTFTVAAYSPAKDEISIRSMGDSPAYLVVSDGRKSAAVLLTYPADSNDQILYNSLHNGFTKPEDEHHFWLKNENGKREGVYRLGVRKGIQPQLNETARLAMNQKQILALQHIYYDRQIDTLALKPLLEEMAQLHHMDKKRMQISLVIGSDALQKTYNIPLSPRSTPKESPQNHFLETLPKLCHYAVDHHSGAIPDPVQLMVDITQHKFTPEIEHFLEHDRARGTQEQELHPSSDSPQNGNGTQRTKERPTREISAEELQAPPDDLSALDETVAETDMEGDIRKKLPPGDTDNLTLAIVPIDNPWTKKRDRKTEFSEHLDAPPILAMVADGFREGGEKIAEAFMVGTEVACNIAREGTLHRITSEELRRKLDQASSRISHDSRQAFENMIPGNYLQGTEEVTPHHGNGKSQTER